MLLFYKNVLMNFGLMFESRTVFAEVFLFLGFTLVWIFLQYCFLVCTLSPSLRSRGQAHPNTDRVPGDGENIGPCI